MSSSVNETGAGSMQVENMTWLQQLQGVLLAATLAGGLWIEHRGPHPGNRGHTRRNLTMMALFMAVTSVLGGVSAALLIGAERHGWGALAWIPLAGWARVAVAVLVVDLCSWIVHALKHRVPLLWRFHRVHHSDLALSVTTTYRHHPIDVVLGWGLRTLMLGALGVPAVAVALFTLYLCAVEQMLHTRAPWPTWLDRWFGWLLVTPAAHRAHHDRHHDRCNYGVGLVWWDRLAGTHVDPAAIGQATFGVDALHDDRHQTVQGMLATPWQPITPRSRP